MSRLIKHYFLTDSAECAYVFAYVISSNHAKLYGDRGAEAPSTLLVNTSLDKVEILSMTEPNHNIPR